MEDEIYCASCNDLIEEDDEKFVCFLDAGKVVCGACHNEQTFQYGWKNQRNKKPKNDT